MAPPTGSDGVRVTIFASSTPWTAAAHSTASKEFGRLLAEAGCVAVFGGGNAGCMGAFYEGVRAAGGRVHGITHRMFVEPGGSGSSLTKEDAGELESLEIVEGKDLTMRKRRLLDAGDCLVALPGGVGTLDELFMAVTENGVAMFSKQPLLPILLLNVDGYYDGVIEQMRRAKADGMLRHEVPFYFHVVSTPAEAVAWCCKQPCRGVVPPAPPPERAVYRAGVVHGAVAGAMAAAVAAAVAMRWR